MKTPMAEIPVLVLVGGKGTRLASVVSDVPKPMAPIDGKPFLDFVLSYLKEFGFQKMILLTGHKSEVIREYFSDGKRLGLDISYSHEDQPLGTGGALRKAILPRTESHYLILNGDTFYNINYQKFISLCNSPVNMALHRVSSPERYGTVRLDSEQKVTAFLEKNSALRVGDINAGIYLINRDIVFDIPEGFVSLESDVFPKLVEKRQVRGIAMTGEFIDIGIPEDYMRAKIEIPRWIESKRGGYE